MLPSIAQQTVVKMIWNSNVRYASRFFVTFWIGSIINDLLFETAFGVFCKHSNQLGLELITSDRNWHNKSGLIRSVPNSSFLQCSLALKCFFFTLLFFEFVHFVCSNQFLSCKFHKFRVQYRDGAANVSDRDRILQEAAHKAWAYCR